jgi:hypothetical protein
MAITAETLLMAKEIRRIDAEGGVDGSEVEQLARRIYNASDICADFDRAHVALRDVPGGDREWRVQAACRLAAELIAERDVLWPSAEACRAAELVLRDARLLREGLR